MNNPAALLTQVTDDLRALLSDDTVAGLSVAERAETLRLIGDAARLVEAVTVELVATADVDFGHRFGCHGMNELLQRTLLVDGASAARMIRVADAVEREVSLVSGERLPARWPALREALLDGAVGVAGLRAATAPLEHAGDRIGAEGRREADMILARIARGNWDALTTDGDAEASVDAGPGADAGVDGGSDADNGEHDGPRATPGELTAVARILAMRLDPDGAEPTDENAQRRRYIKVGVGHDGLYRISGTLLPEVAAQLRAVFDAYNNPKVGGAPQPGVRFVDEAESAGAGAGTDDSDERAPVDPRTAVQRNHDALAAALAIAARHDEMPRLGGAAPTLVVQVEADALAHGTGWATIPGIDEPVPLAVAAQAGCTGTIQRVFTDRGRIVGIGVTDRVFTAPQRRAITVRDRECVIPGCRVPASWCEIHHVTEHVRGGPTHTDNGITLCWWHHRSLHTSGWEVRMNDGRPEIRGPAWWDPLRRWRRPHHALDSAALAS